MLVISLVVIFAVAFSEANVSLDHAHVQDGTCDGVCEKIAYCGMPTELALIVLRNQADAQPQGQVGQPQGRVGNRRLLSNQGVSCADVKDDNAAFNSRCNSLFKCGYRSEKLTNCAEVAAHGLCMTKVSGKADAKLYRDYCCASCRLDSYLGCVNDEDTDCPAILGKDFTSAPTKTPTKSPTPAPTGSPNAMTSTKIKECYDGRVKLLKKNSHNQYPQTEEARRMKLIEAGTKTQIMTLAELAGLPAIAAASPLTLAQLTAQGEKQTALYATGVKPNIGAGAGSPGVNLGTPVFSATANVALEQKRICSLTQEAFQKENDFMTSAAPGVGQACSGNSPTTACLSLTTADVAADAARIAQYAIYTAEFESKQASADYFAKQKHTAIITARDKTRQAAKDAFDAAVAADKLKPKAVKPRLNVESPVAAWSQQCDKVRPKGYEGCARTCLNYGGSSYLCLGLKNSGDTCSNTDFEPFCSLAENRMCGSASEVPSCSVAAAKGWCTDPKYSSLMVQVCPASCNVCKTCKDYSCPSHTVPRLSAKGSKKFSEAECCIDKKELCSCNWECMFEDNCCKDFDQECCSN